MIFVALAGVSVACCSAPAGNCGFERQSVKVATDREASLISLTPQDTTIAALTALPAPNASSRRYDTRFETTIYRVRATLAELSYSEADGDYHLVLADEVGRTMVAEAPDPSCALGSVLGEQISEVRNRIDARYRPRAEPGVPVMVSGVGFFDRIHDVAGQAPNGIELHPIVAIEWQQ